MATREIPRGEWVSFFDSFSNVHRGWLVTVEIMSPDIGDQIEARNLPLERITAKLNEGGEDVIEIVAGAEEGRSVSDTIAAPKAVWLKEADDGAEEALEIVGRDNTILIRFRAATRPEFVDGVLV
jgi:hypothetical protein